MEIYVDIFLLENISINLFLLLLTLKLLRFQYNKIWLYLSSIIGGAYSLVIFCDIRFLSSAMVKILVAIAMIFLAIRQKKVINVVKSVFLFFMLSFMLSGICFASVFMQNTYLVGEEFTISNNSIKQVIISVMIAYIVITRISDHIKDRSIVKNFLYDIYINKGDKSLLIRGFLDTGNELREPVSNLPCIILEEEYFREFNIPSNEEYIINYDTINEMGSLRGFKVNNIKIRNDSSNTWNNVDAIICSCQRKLSKSDDFQALLSRGVI